MIKINDVSFITEEVKVSYDKFSISDNGHKIQGISPYISFYIKDNQENRSILSVETTYLVEYFKTLKTNEEIDCSKYISDIIYKENEVWNSLITGKYTCKLIKKNKSKYKIILKCYYKDLDYIINLNLEETIEF